MRQHGYYQIFLWLCYPVFVVNFVDKSPEWIQWSQFNHVCAGGSVRMTPASKKKRLMTLLGGADNKEKVTHKFCSLIW